MIELIWDAQRRGTGQTASGASLTVGESEHFSPTDLLSLAAASCVMQTFLALAEPAGLRVLSYLSTADVTDRAAPAQPRRVRVRAYVTTARPEDRDRLKVLANQAKNDSLVASLLSDRVEFSVDICVLNASTEPPR